jgi:hypothetical protein
VCHCIRNPRFAIDLHRVDVIASKLLQLFDCPVRFGVGLQVGVGGECLIHVAAKEQGLGKAHLVDVVAENLLGFGNLLFSIDSHA